MKYLSILLIALVISACSQPVNRKVEAIDYVVLKTSLEGIVFQDNEGGSHTLSVSPRHCVNMFKNMKVGEIVRIPMVIGTYENGYEERSLYDWPSLCILICG